MRVGKGVSMMLKRLKKGALMSGLILLAMTATVFPQAPTASPNYTIKASRSFARPSIQQKAPFYIDFSIQSETVAKVTADVPYNKSLMALQGIQKVVEYKNTMSGGFQTILHQRYQFVPIKPGKVEEMPLTVFIGDTISTKSFDPFVITPLLTASKEAPSSHQTAIKTSKLIEKVAKKTLPKSTQQTTDIFLKAKLSHSQIYQGEGVLYTLKLYRKKTAYRWDSIIFPKPILPDFNAYDLMPTPEKLETIGGERFYVLDLLKRMIYPTKTGELSINTPSVLFKNSYHKQGVWVSHPALSITVVPLPTKTEGSVFSETSSRASKDIDLPNFVGIVTLSDSLEKSPFVLGTPFSYQIELNGTIDFSKLSSLSHVPVSGLDVFPKKSSLKIDPKTGAVIGRQFEYVILPKSLTPEKIPEFSLTYFDTRQNKWQTLRTIETPILIQEKARNGLVNGLETNPFPTIYPVQAIGALDRSEPSLWAYFSFIVLSMWSALVIGGGYRILIKKGGLKKVKQVLLYHKKRHRVLHKLKAMRRLSLDAVVDKEKLRFFLIRLHEYLFIYFEEPLRGVNKPHFYQIMRHKNVLPNHAAQLYGVLTGLESGLIASVDPALLQRQLNVLNQILYQLEKQR